MKRRMFFCMMLLFASLCIVSCKDDEPTEGLSKAIEGTYSGVAPAVLVEFGIETLSIKLESAMDSKVNVSVLTELPVIGKLTTISADVTATDVPNTYKVTGASSFNFTLGEISLNVPLLIDGSVVVSDTKTIVARITVGEETDYPLLPFPLLIDFTGTTSVK
ncbi:MAG: hypothetical protein LBS54_02910 [Dysgonamonadaceae bacterium]|jgi:hypothetical protein|nr:hypothetical protein [Dysgonamonadaceae bacterium]